MNGGEGGTFACFGYWFSDKGCSGLPSTEAIEMTTRRRARHENADGHIMPLEATAQEIEDLQALVGGRSNQQAVDCFNARIHRTADGSYRIEWKGAGHQVSNVETLTAAEMRDILDQFQGGR